MSCLWEAEMAKIVFQRVISDFYHFPFVNLQIKSIVVSLRLYSRALNEKISDLLKNMHFWVKNRFSEILIS